jgi:hypothetical protein
VLTNHAPKVAEVFRTKKQFSDPQPKSQERSLDCNRDCIAIPQVVAGRERIYFAWPVLYDRGFGAAQEPTSRDAFVARSSRSILTA